MKVVINACYGGFSLSDEAICRYAELKGIKLWSRKDSFLTMYYTVPPEEYNKLNKADAKNGNYAKSNAVCFSDRKIARDDSILIQVVKELKKKANGRYADLKIVEIPDNVKYEIEEYDGNEHIAEQHRTWY